MNQSITIFQLAMCGLFGRGLLFCEEGWTRDRTSAPQGVEIWIWNKTLQTTSNNYSRFGIWDDGISQVGSFYR